MHKHIHTDTQTHESRLQLPCKQTGHDSQKVGLARSPCLHSVSNVRKPTEAATCPRGVSRDSLAANYCSSSPASEATMHGVRLHTCRPPVAAGAREQLYTSAVEARCVSQGGPTCASLSRPKTLNTMKGAHHSLARVRSFRSSNSCNGLPRQPLCALTVHTCSLCPAATHTHTHTAPCIHS